MTLQYGKRHIVARNDAILSVSDAVWASMGLLRDLPRNNACVHVDVDLDTLAHCAAIIESLPKDAQDCVAAVEEMYAATSSAIGVIETLRQIEYMQCNVVCKLYCERLFADTARLQTLPDLQALYGIAVPLEKEVYAETHSDFCLLAALS